MSRRMTIAVVLVAVLVMGSAWQAVASAADRSRHQPPGRLIDVSGGTLHLLGSGQEHGGPTILLEAGSTSFSGQWHWVQQRLSESFHVVSYDRPGLGWSRPYDGPHDAEAVASRLTEALAKAGISGPFVVVGHSYGSFVSRVFAAQHRDEVVGMALVDATHPDQFGGQAIGAGLFGIAPALAHTGLLRVLNPARGATIGLPEEVRDAAIAFFSSSDHLATVAAEADIWHVSADQAAAAGDFADLPLLIISAESMTANLPRWPEHQAALATLSTSNTHLQFDAPVTHESLVTDRATARRVADAIATLVSSP